MLSASLTLPVAAGLLGAVGLAAAQVPAFYRPSPANSRIVSVAPTGNAEAAIVVFTEGIAIKETGPKETVDHFGEVYAFSPSFIAVRRDQPTEISFWNLQPDDDHDLMLVDPEFNVLMFVDLPPLRKTSYVFTFHREGLFPFYCTMHQPEMSGQILVLPPMRRR
jgi:plastocyanin